MSTHFPWLLKNAKKSSQSLAATVTLHGDKESNMISTGNLMFSTLGTSCFQAVCSCLAFHNL